MKVKQVFDVIFQIIFWLWNLTFLSVVYLGILPFIAVPLIQATIDGIVPGEFLITAVALIGVPTVCTLLAARYFRRQPLQLMRLFYGVEAPLFLLCLLRLFVLRELTGASSLVVGTIVLCIAAFLVEMLYGYLGTTELDRPKSNSQNASNTQPFVKQLIGEKQQAWLQLGCHSLMLLVGVWTAALLLFYAVPVALYTVVGFLSFAWVQPIWDILKYGQFLTVAWWLVLSLVLFGFSCSLFVAMPSLFGFLYIQSGRKILRSFSSQYGKNAAIFGSVGVIATWLAVFAILQQQPQVQALKMLATPAANETVRQSLLAKSDKIRSGLVNAYLSPYRYLSTVGENNHIYGLYKNYLGLSDAAARALQNSYNNLMSPFLYQGSSDDVKKAEKLYAGFFDTEIQKGDAAAVKHAVQSTSNREEAKAGLLNV
ncbi:MAG: TIGR02921 family PEP-CTERM protein, partial [Microcoleus sp.]